jgi:hypothetical protein
MLSRLGVGFCSVHQIYTIFFRAQTETYCLNGRHEIKGDVMSGDGLISLPAECKAFLSLTHRPPRKSGIFLSHFIFVAKISTDQFSPKALITE